MIADDEEIRVLFVDDDEDFLELASQLLVLENDRIDLFTESSPQNVLDRLAEIDVDCIVSDYKMAELDGIELLERTRNEYPTLPFIIFTAKGDEKVAGEVIGAGGTDYVINTGSPDQYTVLANRIETIVGRQRSERIATQHRRIDSIYRSLSQRLLEESTQAQIEQAVCGSLAEFDAYDIVWIGELTPTDSLEFRTVSETEFTFGDLALDGADLPERTALATDSIEVINDVPATYSADSPHPVADLLALRSLITIPITARGVSYGGLTIYSTVADVFTRREIDMLADLSDLIGFMIGAAEQREGMFSYTVNEVELTVSDSSAALITLAEALGTVVRLEGTVPRPDGTFVLFLSFESTVPDEPRVRETFTTVFDSGEPELIDPDDPTRWSVVSSTWFGEALTYHGVQLQEVIADGDTARLLLACPTTVDVRDIVALLEGKFSSVDITAQRQRSQAATASPAVDSVLDELTPRQRDVLEAAYRRGFFEWPRSATAEEIAHSLDISQPAFSRHIRRSEQTVFERLFEESHGSGQ